ncbi:MAG: endolytic transglycosylase MltG [Candidatus Binatia bacterium]
MTPSRRRPANHRPSPGVASPGRAGRWRDGFGPLTALAAAVGLLCALAAARAAFLLLAPLDIRPAVETEVARGTNTARIAEQLESSGVVRSARALVFLSRIKRNDRAIHLGRHRFEGRMTPAEVLEELLNPSRDTVRVTMPEGLNMLEMAVVLERAGLVSADDYLAAACDERFLREVGAAAEANCSEGYLCPDTYMLTPGMEARAIVRLQYRRFRQVLAELASSMDGAAIASSLDASEEDRTAGARAEEATLNEIVTLASIIEKESYLAEERPLIGSVFTNRLKRKMKLQADPTVIYGIVASGREWNGNITKRDLQENTRYNSYYHRGLPPGPICNPGRGALAAALHPAETDYLYFVARKDGSHEFSRSVRDHNRAVRKYQLRH